MKFLYSVKPPQRHDAVIISTRSIFSKSFSFYSLTTSYKPTRGHHNLVFSLLKAYLEQYQILILIKIYVKTSVNYRFCDTHISGGKKPKIWGAFHLSELTRQPIPIVMRISLLVKTNHPDESNPKYYAQMRWFFQQNLLEKACFIAKMSGPVG